jgi:hypothetical protein
VVKPACTVVTPSVFVIERSACGVSVSVSVAELLPGVGSVVVDDTVPVFDSVPVADGEMEQTAVNVTLELGGSVMPPSLILPANGPASLPVAPPAATLVVEHVRIAAKVSATVTPVDVLGPALLVVIVYVTLPPGIAVVTPSVLVIETSADGTSVSVSVAELLPAFGSVTPPPTVTVAVLTSEPIADGSIVPVAV